MFNIVSNYIYIRLIALGLLYHLASLASKTPPYRLASGSDVAAQLGGSTLSQGRATMQISGFAESMICHFCPMGNPLLGESLWINLLIFK